ncbi:MAG TPA: L-rhamnose mutarotase [Dehalococcoidia bacterium]|jgi:L-rhamnose mutarotase|nr:L-rhamnose mutarotase [Chloroflexota bacterium]MDP5878018.1 L-rhamnose mutarotase [Dehalococcoidia bacterium]MDP6274173.1 L-rhamnose mutarotase [Dehalococcoidia bacterium]MDP7161598.1 L-rhamnose mutarotase [Dehalococcoidia bacterium]MDP7214229.1 L-rhamnose mutarotase [Dehalococcoidia bacterium]|tara:strand:- start:1047 stop:1370 length:324 start_codon:yes stop_codon:yes gene_type:complete
MQRVGFLLKVKEDRIPEYKAHHRAVSPDMLDALRRNGWGNYSLFMRPDGLMFGYVEVSDDFRAALDGMSGEDANSRWQTLMEPFFESPGGGRPDENMVELEEVFHLD